MTLALKSIARSATALAIEIALAKILPAIAVGLVAMAHEIHFESAVREGAKRKKGI